MWGTIQASNSERQNGQASVALSALGDDTQSSWLRASVNKGAATQVDKTAAISIAQHVYGRFGQGPSVAIPVNQQTEFAYKYLDPVASNTLHGLMVSIFPAKHENADWNSASPWNVAQPPTKLSTGGSKIIEIECSPVKWINHDSRQGLVPSGQPLKAMDPDLTTGAQKLKMVVVFWFIGIFAIINV